MSADAPIDGIPCGQPGSMHDLCGVCGKCEEDDCDQPHCVCCPHDWEHEDYTHEVDETPVSMDMRDRIHYERFTYHASEKQRCAKCNQTREVAPEDATCECPPP